MVVVGAAHIEKLQLFVVVAVPLTVEEEQPCPGPLHPPAHELREAATLNVRVQDVPVALRKYELAASQ